MALNSDGVMLLAPGMAWGTLRERPVPLEVLEPDAWARGDDGLGESIPPPGSDSIPPPAPRRAQGVLSNAMRWSLLPVFLPRTNGVDWLR